MPSHTPIGVFDSGYGGLTVLREIMGLLPEYDYCYLGDNARNPYGTHSFKKVYEYTRQCVQWLFAQGCPLVILACNTASAKALRTIQQKDLPGWNPENRVLGVIRPTAEVIGKQSESGIVGILGTFGTVKSESYLLEIEKSFPEIRVVQQACPLWVPLIEQHEFDSEGGKYFIRKYIDEILAKAPEMDTLLLACTHYPVLYHHIREQLPEQVKVISQGPIVARALEDYLRRHPQMEQRLSRNGQAQYFTTDDPEDFDKHAPLFLGKNVASRQTDLTLSNG